jgi:mono/diheme cytochrome c family protein
MKFILALVIVLLVLATAGLYAILRGGVSTSPQPGVVETRVARSLRHFAIPAKVRDRHNPIATSATVVAEGRAHFADHCALCHANDGSGSTEMGRNLYPRAPDMRRASTQNLSDGELFAIIRDGVRLTGMPGWGGSDTDNWTLVQFVRHLPDVTPEEIEEMERLNPKPPAEIDEQRREDDYLKGH